MVLLATAGLNNATAQETAKPVAVDAGTVIKEPNLQNKLLETTESIKTKEKELKLLEQKIKTSKDQNFLKQAEQEETEYKEIITELKNEFIDLATGGAKLYVEPKQPEQGFDWHEDLKTIAGPLLGGTLIGMHMPLPRLFLVAAAPMVLGTVAALFLARLCYLRFGGHQLDDTAAVRTLA